MVRHSIRKNRREREERIFIPKSRYDPYFRVFIKWNDDDWSDETKYILKTTVAKRATDAIDYFTFSLDDYNNRFKDKIKGGEWVAIYMNYGFPNQRIITARLEKWSWSYQPMTGLTIKEVRGRAWPEFKDKTISIKFKKRNIEDAIADVIAHYGELSINVNGISTETISANYQRQSGLTIIKDICTRFGLEFYIDVKGVVHVIDTSLESSKITTDAISLQQNLTAIETWEMNTSSIKNRVSVTGQQDDYITYQRTVNNEVSQEQFWVKDVTIFDSAISTHDEIYDRCDQELSIKNANKNTIRLASIGMIDAQPGKKIHVSAPPLDENWHLIKSCSHTIDEQGYKTSFTLNNVVKSVPQLFVERKKNERELRPSALSKVYDDCLVFDFKDLTKYTLDNCSVKNGYLIITDPNLKSSCEFNTDVKGLITDAKTRSAYVQASGQDFENIKVKVSNDEGLNYLTFEGSALNHDELQFNTLDNTHRVTINLENGAEGSLTPVKIRKLGVYLEHDTESIPLITIPLLYFDEHKYYTDEQFTFTEYVFDKDYYDSTNSNDVIWDNTEHKITIKDVLYLKKIDVSSDDFTKIKLDLNPEATGNSEIFISFDEKATWVKVTDRTLTDIPVSTYSSIYVKVQAIPNTFGTTGLSFPILFSASNELQGESTASNPLVNPAIKISLTKG